MDICKAISERRLISFTYDGHDRIVAPATLGKHATTGNRVLRGYQTGGTSKSQTVPFWKIFLIEKISDFKILDDSFKNNPDGYTRGDSDISPIDCEL